MIKKGFAIFLLLPISIFLVLFVLLPYLNIIINSFKDRNTGEFTLKNWENFFNSSHYVIALKNSVVFSSVCTLIAAIFGSIIGWGSRRLSENIVDTLRSVFSIPLTLSGLVVAFSFIVLLGRSGIYNTLVSMLGLDFLRFNIYSWEGLVVVYSFYNIPLFSITMMGAFQKLDINIIEAARNLGANKIQTWFYIIIPNLAPAFVAATALVFAGMMGAFGTALALTGLSKILLSLLIWSTASESNFNIPQANVLAIILGISIYISLYLLMRLEKRLKEGTK
jgi:ABC-type Fe3+ transport system permease subunit